MWIKNVKTGHKWKVTEEHAERLLKSEDYLQVEEEPKKPTTKRNTKPSE